MFPAWSISRLIWSLAGALWAPGEGGVWVKRSLWSRSACTEMCLKLLSNTSFLFQSLIPLPGAGCWWLAGPRSTPPNLLMSIPSVRAYALKHTGLPPGAHYLQITKPAAENVSSWPPLCLCSQCMSDRCYQHPRGPSPPPSQYLWMLTEMSAQKGSAGLSQLLGKFALIFVYVVIVRYSEDCTLCKVSVLF